MKISSILIVRGTSCNCRFNNNSIRIEYNDGSFAFHDLSQISHLRVDDVDELRDEATLIIGGMKLAGTFKYTELRKLMDIVL